VREGRYHDDRRHDHDRRRDLETKTPRRALGPGRGWHRRRRDAHTADGRGNHRGGDDPNVLEAGEVDLTVDWEVEYFGAGTSPETIASQPEPVDRPRPIVDLTDVEPGDVVEKTLSAHVATNPGFLIFSVDVLADRDNGINDPEDAVDGAFDGSDGTEGGDLADHLNCVVRYDGFEDSDGNEGGSGESSGNNRPDEDSWMAGGDPTDHADFEAGLDDAQSPSDAFDTDSDLVAASGTLAEVADATNPFLIDSRQQGDTPEDFAGLACHDDGAVYLGCVCWLPRNIDGVGDNVVQTDRLEYKFSLGAIQCRDNVADDGTPISVDVAPRTGDGGGDGGPTTFPGTQQDKLTATDPEQNDFLDTAVAVDGDTALPGARSEDENGSQAGAAYVFTRSAAAGASRTSYPPTTETTDFFGASVALDAGRALVGAENDDQSDIVGAGSAHVFVP